MHHVKFEMWPALCKLPILFSTVKLKLGHNSQFTYRFKIETFESWSLAVLPSFSQFTKRLKFGFSNVTLAERLNFSQFIKEIKNWDF